MVALTEKRVVVLGTVQVEDGGRLVLPAIDLNADPAAITAALEEAEAERFEAQKSESAALANMFLPADKPIEDKPPVTRDWLFL
jgi:hypothetical protein